MLEMIKRAKELLSDNSVDRVIGWKRDESGFNPEISVFRTAEELELFVYDGFCSANMSKMLINETKKEGKVLAFLKPCDTYSMNQLLCEHRIDREKLYIIGVGCKGKLDQRKFASLKIKGILSVSGAGFDDKNEIVAFKTVYGERKVPYKELMLERCAVCKGKEHRIFDEIIGESEETAFEERFAQIESIERMSPEERYKFFRSELSKCIRCNACRNACPACSCRKCVFDSNNFDSSQKANVDSFEEKMFHIIRSFHVSGRCTDCGECSRVCPQGIPLHLFNRKFIKDINDFYGEYQAGETSDARGPLVSFETDDPEPYDNKGRA